MKFNCGARVQRKEQWHRWFAWHPVRVGPNDCRWLETVERKGEFLIGFQDCFWLFEYRSTGEEQ